LENHAYLFPEVNNIHACSIDILAFNRNFTFNPTDNVKLNICKNNRYPIGQELPNQRNSMKKLKGDLNVNYITKGSG